MYHNTSAPYAAWRRDHGIQDNEPLSLAVDRFSITELLAAYDSNTAVLVALKLSGRLNINMTLFQSARDAIKDELRQRGYDLDNR